MSVRPAADPTVPAAPGADAPAERRSADAGQTEAGLPLWFACLVAVACAGVLSFGGFGLLLAVLGDYSGGTALALGALGTIAGLVVCWQLRPSSRQARRPAAVVPAVGACVVAAAVSIWNSLDIGHHVVVDRDPGVYLVAGRWLAQHSSLVVPGGVPWRGLGVNVNWASAGMYPSPNGTLQFQFAHLLPVLLAEGYRIGSNGLMFRIPAVLGGLALLAVYAVGVKLVRRPWLALAATTGLGVCLPELYVSRETFSEPATQVLLWGGIWLMIEAFQRRRMSVALLAGLAIGGTLMTRIDGVAYLIPLPLLGAVGWVTRTSAADRRSFLRVCAAFVVGVVPAAVLGTIDVQRRSAGYYEALHSQVVMLYVALTLAAVVGALIVAVWPRASALRSWWDERRKQVGVGAAWVVGGALLLLWSLRPAGPKSSLPGAGVRAVVAGLQRGEGITTPIQGYAEQSMTWIGWYVGPVVLALAVVGLCLLTSQAVGRGFPAALVVLAMAAPLTAIYIWRPDITPEQIWAMRRYAPASLPLLFLVAAAAVDIAAAGARIYLRNRGMSRAVLAAGVFGIVAFPLGTSLQVGNFSDQANYFPLVERVCTTVGPRGVVLFPLGDLDGFVLGQTIRSWCNVPTASLISNSTVAADTIAAAFAKQNRTVWLIGTSQQSLLRVDPDLTPTLLGRASSLRQLERTVERPPENYNTSTLTIEAARVP